MGMSPCMCILLNFLSFMVLCFCYIIIMTEIKPIESSSTMHVETVGFIKRWKKVVVNLTSESLYWYPDGSNESKSKSVTLKQIDLVVEGNCEKKHPLAAPEGFGFEIQVHDEGRSYPIFFYCNADTNLLKRWIRDISHNITILRGGYTASKERKMLETMEKISKYKLKLQTKEGKLMFFTGAGKLVKWKEHFVCLDKGTFSVYKKKGGKKIFELPSIAECEVESNDVKPAYAPDGMSFQLVTRYGEAIKFCGIEPTDKSSWISIIGNNVLFANAGLLNPTTESRAPTNPITTPSQGKAMLSNMSIKEIKQLCVTHNVDITTCLSKEQMIDLACLSEAILKHLAITPS